MANSFSSRGRLSIGALPSLGRFSFRDRPRTGTILSPSRAPFRSRDALARRVASAAEDQRHRRSGSRRRRTKDDAAKDGKTRRCGVRAGEGETSSTRRGPVNSSLLAFRQAITVVRAGRIKAAPRITAIAVTRRRRTAQSSRTYSSY